jgi:glycosyltransferase involved in cell wall biosynthesis
MTSDTAQVSSPGIIDSAGLASHLAVLQQLLGTPVSGSVVDATESLALRFATVTESEMWLVLAVLSGELPRPDAVVGWHRRVQLEGGRVVLDALTSGRRKRPVRILHGGVVIDAHHTVATDVSTGIQRVTRNVLEHWVDSHDYVLAMWDRDFVRLHEVARDAHRTLQAPASRDAVSIIPWRVTYLLPELSVERPRLERIQALAQYSAVRSGAIGFDLVPITSAETTGPGMPGAFSENLSAIARMQRVATISAAAATEYRGWGTMLESAGVAGPEIAPIDLPFVEIAGTGEVPDARAELGLTDSPIVACIGSHEPRKNHLAVLQAAEILWREGLDFQLVFCGGRSWRSERFFDRLASLRDAGRPVDSHTGVSDATLTELMRIARFTVFPSLNEGYGLPIVESLAVGTPVVTSRYGSMAEIARGGGTVMVDPRDDDDIASGIRTLLTDDVLLARLETEAAARPRGTWGEYSEALWGFLVG